MDDVRKKNDLMTPKNKFIQNVYALRNVEFVSIMTVGDVRVHNIKDYSVRHSGSAGIH